MPPGGYQYSYDDEEYVLDEAPPPAAPVAQDKYSAGGYETSAAPAAAPAPEAAPPPAPAAEPPPAAEPQYAADNPYSETMPAEASGSAPSAARDAAPQETDAPPPAKPSNAEVASLHQVSQYNKNNVYTAPAASQARGADAAGSAGITPAKPNPYAATTPAGPSGAAQNAARSPYGMGGTMSPDDRSAEEIAPRDATGGWQQNIGKGPKQTTPVYATSTRAREIAEATAAQRAEHNRQREAAATATIRPGESGRQAFQGSGTTNFQGTGQGPATAHQDPTSPLFGTLSGKPVPVAASPDPPLSPLGHVGAARDALVKKLTPPEDPHTFWEHVQTKAGELLDPADSFVEGGVKAVLAANAHPEEIPVVGHAFNPETRGVGGPRWAPGSDSPMQDAVNRAAAPAIEGGGGGILRNMPLIGGTVRSVERGRAADAQARADAEMQARISGGPAYGPATPPTPNPAAADPASNAPRMKGGTQGATRPMPTPGDPAYGRTDVRPNPTPGVTPGATEARDDFYLAQREGGLSGDDIRGVGERAPTYMERKELRERKGWTGSRVRPEGGDLPGSAADQMMVNSLTGGTTGRNARTVPDETDAPPPAAPQTLGQERERVGETTQQPVPVEGGGFFDGLGGFARDKWDGATGKIGDANAAATRWGAENIGAPLEAALGPGVDSMVEALSKPQPGGGISSRQSQSPAQGDVPPRGGNMPAAGPPESLPVPRPPKADGASIDGQYVEGAVLGTEAKLPPPPKPNSKINGNRNLPPVTLGQEKEREPSAWEDRLYRANKWYDEHNDATDGGFNGLWTRAGGDELLPWAQDVGDIVTGDGTIRQKARNVDDKVTQDAGRKKDEVVADVADALGPTPVQQIGLSAPPSGLVANSALGGRNPERAAPAAAKATEPATAAPKQGPGDPMFGRTVGGAGATKAGAPLDDNEIVGGGDSEWIPTIKDGKQAWILVSKSQKENAPDGSERPYALRDRDGKTKVTFVDPTGGDPVAAADVPAAAPAPAASSSSGSGGGSSSSSDSKGSGWVDYPKKEYAKSGGSGGWSRSSGGSSGGGGGWSRSSSSGKSGGRWPFGGSDGDHILDAKGGKWKFDSKTGMWTSSDGRRSRKRPKGRLVKGKRGMFGQRPESGVFNPGIFDRYKDVSGQDLSWGPVSDGMVGGVPVAGAPVEFGTPPPTHPARAGKAGKRKG